MRPVCRICKTYLRQKKDGDWLCPMCNDLTPKEQNFCFSCGRPLVRVHKDGNIYCSFCNEKINRKVNSYSKDFYIQCPNAKCSYSGPELINPKAGTRCPVCGTKVL